MSVRQKMLADLERSGITEQQATQLKLKPLSATATDKLVGKKAESYQIPYFDINGKPIDFYRVRLLEEPKSFGKGKAKKPQRYVQPKGERPYLYFPPIIDWRAIAQDPTYPIYITEGEKKAAATTLFTDFPCIGLGGVWSWRAIKKSLNLLPEFYDIVWEEREVFIVFDSDAATNANVVKAMVELSKELINLGAIVYTGNVPQNGEEKQGLDDYLVAGGDINEIHISESARGIALNEVNSRICLIKNPPSFYDFESMNLVGKEWAATACAPITFVEEVGDKKREFSAFNEWIKWPCRAEYRGMIYAPEQPHIIDREYINTWKGWGTEPKRGEVKPFLEMLKHMIPDSDFREWFLQWLSYPLQNPGTKLKQAVLLWSIQHGTGKSFIGYIMNDIYGEHGAIIGERDLHSNFNTWMINKSFIMGEELTGTAGRKEADHVKSLITQEKVTINQKYVPEYVIPDTINYLLTSNHPNALYLEEHDRRFAVYNVAPPADYQLYQRVDEWRKRGGAAHLHYYLLHNVDCSSFDINRPAPMTEHKEQMISVGRSEKQDFAHTLVKHPEEILNIDNIPLTRDIYTMQELKELYARHYDKNIEQVTSLGAVLNEAGVYSKRVKVDNRTKVLYAVRNIGKWSYREGKEWADEYSKDMIDPKITPLRKFQKQREEE